MVVDQAVALERRELGQPRGEPLEQLALVAHPHEAAGAGVHHDGGVGGHVDHDAVGRHEHRALLAAEHAHTQRHVPHGVVGAAIGQEAPLVDADAAVGGRAVSSGYPPCQIHWSMMRRTGSPLDSSMSFHRSWVSVLP